MTRRIPTQRRSRERLERILEAAAHVFADVGYDAATTEAIAARAGTSIGSVYQFFPNKQALFDAIASRYLEQTKELFDQMLTPEALDVPWDALIDRMLDAFAELHRTSAGFRAVWLNLQLVPGFIAAGEALNDQFAERVADVLARQAKGLPRARRGLVATTIVEVVSAMLLVTVRRDARTADALVGETKVLLRRYLEPYLASARHTRQSRRISPSGGSTRSRAFRRPAS